MRPTLEQLEDRCCPAPLLENPNVITLSQQTVPVLKIGPLPTLVNVLGTTWNVPAPELLPPPTVVP